MIDPETAAAILARPIPWTYEFLHSCTEAPVEGFRLRQVLLIYSEGDNSEVPQEFMKERDAGSGHGVAGQCHPGIMEYLELHVRDFEERGFKEAFDRGDLMLLKFKVKVPA